MSKGNLPVKLRKVRIQWVNLFEKSKIGDKFVQKESDREYSVEVLLHKEDHKEEIQAIHDAVKRKLEYLGLKRLKNDFLKCCDEELDSIDTSTDVGKKKKAALEYMAGHYRMRLASKLPVVLRKVKGVDLDVTKDEDPFYPGSYANIIMEIGSYDSADYGKGISRYLKYVLFAKDGERLGGSKVIDGNFADSQFEDEEEEEVFIDEELF